MNGKGLKHDFATWWRICVALGCARYKKKCIKKYLSSKEHIVEKIH